MTLQAIDTLNHNGGGHDTAVVAGAKGKTDQAIDATLTLKRRKRGARAKSSNEQSQ